MATERIEPVPGATPNKRDRAREIVRSLTSRVASAFASPGESLSLRPLTATPIPDHHDVYVREMVQMLTHTRRRRNLWNIALSGGYGSGKSSVLAAVKARLGRRVVEISLSSLSDIGVQSVSEETTKLIQKEIVKQLLYRERPTKVPGSRFRRVSGLPFGQTLGLALLAGAAAVGTLWLTGWGVPLDLPPNREAERPPLLVAIGTGFALLAFIVQWLLHNRIRIDKLGTSSASVTLKSDGGEESFFDKYLDEVVYFFEMTKKDVVIIEDLDRFENPEIFASLRALNTILNTSSQLRRRPVHFIYAVRDSIFEDLTNKKKSVVSDDKKNTPVITVKDEGTALRVWQADPDLSNPPTQRTKFFDLVIPIVPFITHRTARDLLTPDMERIDAGVSAEVIATVAKHITDMRLLHNMMNEYVVFRSRVLAPRKLKGLTPSGLFAMMAYKNTHLEDFELIRVGNSSLDTLYFASRKIIESELATVAAEISAHEARVAPIAEIDARAKVLGAALQAFASRWVMRLNSSSYVRILTGEVERPLEDLATAEFWEEVVDGAVVVQIRSNSSQDVVRIDAAGLRAELGPIVPERWAVESDIAWERELGALRQRQQSLRSADFPYLAGPNRPRIPTDFLEVHLNPLRDQLLIDLVSEGHIDRNFHLYSSVFHGEVTSANAMNFLVQHVQAETPSFRYPLEPDEVIAVLREGGVEAFGSIGLFNVSIYDGLLATHEEALTRNIKLLSWAQPVDTEFLKIYVAEGAYREELFRRLSPHWAGVFDFLAKELSTPVENFANLALAAFDGADPSKEYLVPESVRDVITAQFVSIPDLVQPDYDPSRAISMLQHMDVRVPSLKSLSKSAIAGLIDVGQYVVTTESLKIALHSSEIGLDVIYRSGRTVLDHVLRHFDEYLAALDAASPEQFSLKDIDVLVDVMTAIETAEVGRSLEILSRLPVGLLVEEVAEIPENILRILATGRRFRLTFANVDRYLAVRSFDDSIVEFLEEERRIDAQDADATQLETLAVKILNETKLSAEARIDLAASLVTGPINARGLASREPALVRLLAESRLILPEASTFALLSNSPESQVALIAGSPDESSSFQQLTLSSATGELLLRDDEISEEVKAEIAAQIANLPQLATAEIFEALAEWGTDCSFVLSEEVVQLAFSTEMSTTGKASILNLGAQNLPLEVLLSLIRLLPDPYSRIAERGTKPVDLPTVPVIDNVLEALKADTVNIVSKWEENGGVTRVWMRRPPRD